jgi:sodium transport system permease protein
MIATLLAVLRKELLETLRDRRSLSSSLLMGPVLGPLLFIAALSLSLKQSVTSLDDAIPVTVAGADHAPHLVQHLRQEGFSVTLRDGDAREIPAWIEADGELVVLLVPEGIGERLLAGETASVTLFADGSNSKADRRASRVRVAIAGYAGTLAALRLQVRGVSPSLMQPVVVDEVDLSTPTSRATLVLGMLSYIILVVTLVGGLSLAIDATAGERERGSLEPLLTVPVPREHLIYGKVLASASFMAVALVLAMATLTASIHRVPLEEIGMSANFDARVAVLLFAVTLPFVAVGASLLTVVASFTRSYKEAQTWLGVVLLVPTLPIAIAGLLDVRASAPLMAVPSLSQHLLIQGLLRDEPLPAGYVAISVASTLALGAALTWLAGRLYRREKILG